VNPRAGLGDVGKRKFLTLKGLELRPLGRPARSQSLYRLRYKKIQARKVQASRGRRPSPTTHQFLRARNNNHKNHCVIFPYSTRGFT
jgi:hypothetical protein